jgi:hypothetical protein
VVPAWSPNDDGRCGNLGAGSLPVPCLLGRHPRRLKVAGGFDLAWDPGRVIGLDSGPHLSGAGFIPYRAVAPRAPTNK